jgi:indole-3-glycerol phosphate synthase
VTYLDDLLSSSRSRLAESRTKLTEAALEQRISSVAPARSLRDALSGPDVSVIAEIKRASPSKGPLAEDLDAAKLARAYAAGGAAAISVLTEPSGFKGSMDDLHAALTADLPVLRKDFLLDPFQILESRAEGADAVLLVVRTVGNELGSLVASARALGMDALVEVFDEPDLERALEVEADLIGINHRDLETFEVDPERTAKLAPQIPDGVVIVGLSGVETRADVEELAAAGAHAVLVGESLVRASDPSAKLRELRGER